MSLNKSCDDQDHRSDPLRKGRKFDGNIIQSLENDSSFQSFSIPINEDNLIVNEGSQNDDDTNEIDDNVSGSYSNNSRKSNKSYDSESDYIPISDGEFELENSVNDEKTNYESNLDTNDYDFIKVNDSDFDKNSIDNDEIDELLEIAFDNKQNLNVKKDKGIKPDDFIKEKKNILNEDNLIVNEGSQNDDDTNEIDDNVSGSYSNSSRKSNKSYDSESDYIPISDGEFDSEKCVSDEKINNECNSDTNVNDFIKVNETNFDKNSTIKIDNDEVDELLEKALDDKHDNSNVKKNKGVQPDMIELEKIILEEICKNSFDILPEDWIETKHKSGMPVYLNKKTRVVTLSRPYYIGPENPKLHLAPLSAISCLQYRKAIASQETIKDEPSFQTNKLDNMIIPNVKVETLENIIKKTLTHKELQEYCQPLFRFKKLGVTSSEQNLESEIFTDAQHETQERPSLSNSTKLITIPTKNLDKRKNRCRKYIMNPNGTSYIKILHEYLQQTLRTTPWYMLKELDNPETPYSATAMLNDVQYGVGMGNSKKQAKLNAARATLEILLPEVKSETDLEHQNLSYPVIFNQIKITDPRVYELCIKTSEPTPFAILQMCLNRNFGKCDISMDCHIKNKFKMLHQFTMTVGKHIVSVACKNKKIGKQKASQKMLALLHPDIDNWGSLIQLYGNQSVMNVKEKKREERKITQLQGKAVADQPNYAIINKLEEEMLKVGRMRKLNSADNKINLLHLQME